MHNLATNPQLLTKVAAIMWNQTILNPAMYYGYDLSIQKVDDKRNGRNKVIKSKLKKRFYHIFNIIYQIDVD